jgi:two-component system, sensor histidine kinase and response regulator
MSPLPTPLLADPTSGPRRTDDAFRVSLADISGLNSEFGLSAVRGRISTYRRLLAKFDTDHLAHFMLIHQHLKTGKSDQAHRLAHSLKGAAGMLGAVEIQKHAANLEVALRESQPLATIEALIEQTATACNNLQRQLQTLPASMPPDLSPSSTQLITQLRLLLASDNIDIKELVRQETTRIRDTLGNHFDAFERLVSKFHFAAALNLLDRIGSCNA